MPNTLYFPLINPVRFYLPEPDTQYHSRHFEDFKFFDTIFPWEQKVCFKQPWQQDDHLVLELFADFGPHYLHFINEDGDDVYQKPFIIIGDDTDPTALLLHILDVDLSVLAEGTYTFRLVSGNEGDNPLIIETNEQDIRNIQPYTLLLKYQNAQYHEGAFFKDDNGDSVYYPSFRTPGGISFKSPASKDTPYEDQPLNETLLYSLPYRLFELTVGDENGVPDYAIDIVNRILTCNDVKCDGRAITKNQGAQWEPNSLDGYPMRGWKIEIREMQNNVSKVWMKPTP